MDFDLSSHAGLVAFIGGAAFAYIRWSLLRFVSEITKATAAITRKIETLDEHVTELKIHAGIAEGMHQRLAEIEILLRDHDRAIAKIQDGHGDNPFSSRRKRNADNS